MLPELRPPARAPERSSLPVGWLLAIVLLLLIAGLYALHRARPDVPIADAGPPTAVAPSTGEAVVSPPPVVEAKPEMDCGYVNGIETCVPRRRANASGAEPDAAERTQRALAIMAETRRSMQAPTQDSRRATRRNPALDHAERTCRVYQEGAIAYRQCRGNVWQWLRDQCIDERGRDIYDGDYCDAERRFIIPE